MQPPPAHSLPLALHCAPAEVKCRRKQAGRRREALNERLTEGGRAAVEEDRPTGGALRNASRPGFVGPSRPALELAFHFCAPDPDQSCPCARPRGNPSAPMDQSRGGGHDATGGGAGGGGGWALRRGAIDLGNMGAGDDIHRPHTRPRDRDWGASGAHRVGEFSGCVLRRSTSAGMCRR
ncbi:hypothetical protein AAFF_G00196630 [Aldrovandia affinis]|uniref:Uncharacterized protein n=1 Tax=Aldrovandia affinis TaxID=143900 RepID=A0AAD7RJG1_9TELE|nr:hypothetical protein AAFF_G00196630 [Aldrovandia affinis]